jgi:serine/threonine protein kinase/tetratricopeptide (TPR) repeat protein
MTAEQWSKVNQIFHEVVDLPEQGRSQALWLRANEDAEIIRAVVELLAADRCEETFLARPPIDGGELESVLSEGEAQALLREGDMLCDRFRIVRMVGQGGMGQVYEAFDVEIRVPIAVKVIRPEIASQESAAKRFRHEVRLARTITHANVCRTFDLERGVVRSPYRTVHDRTLLFLTMEYVDGETLSARLARDGPLSEADALCIAEQIAAGVECAHQRGVIHRDLKPQNILLTEAGARRGPRAVVTDFGLAKLNTSDLTPPGYSSMGHEGQAMGTVAYMAPEQIRGGDGDALSDVYSFGLILYEMITGKAAFSGGTFLEEIGARFEQTPPSLRMLRPELDRAWEATIRRCLAVRPEDRFCSTFDVLAALRDGSSARNARRPLRLLLSPRDVFLAAIALVSLTALFFRYRSAGTAISPTVAPGALVYMPAIRNNTGNATLNSVGQMVLAELAQSPRLRLADQSQEAAALGRMIRPVAPVLDDVEAREVALRLNAQRIILISLDNERELLRLKVAVDSPEADTPKFTRSHWERSWTCSRPAPANAAGLIPPDLMHIIRDASDAVRQKLGEDNADLALLNAPVEELTTMRWDALTEYAKAERLRAQHRSEDAVLALENAVHFDPGFALAWARMGDILFSIERDAEGIRAYQKALDAADERRLTLLERDRLRGLVAIDTWDFATAEAMFHDATMNYDTDYLSWFYRGTMMMQLDRLPEAIAALKRAQQLRPDGIAAPFNLGDAYLIAQDRGQAARIAADERAKGHRTAALWLEAEQQWLVGDLAAADRALAAVDPSDDSFPTVFSLRVRLAVQRGGREAALRLLNQGIREDEAAGAIFRSADKRMDRAYLECGQRSYMECLNDIEGSLRANSGPDSVREAAEALGGAVATHPGRDALNAIQRTLRHLSRTAPGAEFGLSAEIVKAQLEGELSLSEGRGAAAVRSFRRAGNMDPPMAAEFRLGCALRRAAEMEQDEERKKALQQEANQSLSKHPQRTLAFLWHSNRMFAPDVFAQATHVGKGM